MSAYDNLSVVSQGHEILQVDGVGRVGNDSGPTALIRRVRNRLSDVPLSSQAVTLAEYGLQQN